MNTKDTTVLVVGGGFAGVKTALELSKERKLNITLLSDRTDLRYYPALYHSATGGKQAQGSIPLEKLTAGKRITLAQGRAEKLDRKAKTITTADGKKYKFDILILALGVVTNYFGIEGLAEHSFGIKSWEQIQAFKQHIHEQFNGKDTSDLHYVIVGGGPTGIELACALPEYLADIMKHHGVTRKVKIEIVESNPRLLPRSNPGTSKAVMKRAEKLGIELNLGKVVQKLTPTTLTVSGEEIATDTVVWTAGTGNNPFFKDNDFTINERGKVVVDGSLRSEEGIYVLGDNAATPYSGLAQIAIHDGHFAAHDILRRFNSEEPKAYKVAPPITVVPVGPHWAAVEWRGFGIHGWIGWVLRLAADWIGFKDLEPVLPATKQWMYEFGGEEDCATCKKSDS